MATKCLKINDSISNPTMASSIAGIVVVNSAAKGSAKADGTKDLTFNLRMKYFSSEINYDAGKENLLWDNLVRQCTIDITEAEWDGTDGSPKYGNDLVYDKLLAWLLDPAGGGYSSVDIVVK